MTKLSEVERYKLREANQREELCHWLQCDDEHLNTLIFEGAYDYLQNVFGTDAYGLHHLPRTKEFWTWWRMEWNRIDRFFLSAISQRYATEYPQWYCVIRDRDKPEHLHAVHTVQQLRNYYTAYHEASMSNRFINSSVVRAGAHDMINSIVTAQRQTA